jgi:hypothetical protein
MALRRSTPFLPSSSIGSCALLAPREVVSRHAASTSSTAKAMSCTPSPCRATCSAISPSGPIGAVNTNRMSFCTITKLDRSRTPVSSPAYATGVKPQSAR